MRRSWILLAVAAVAVLAVGIDRRELDGTTAFYAALARQVTVEGPSLPLQHGTANYVLKPPLVMWSTAALFDAFGVAPWTSTFVSRFFGLACVGLIVLLARGRDGPAAGWWAGLVVLLTFPFLENAATMRLDTALIAGLTLAMVALFASDGRWRPFAFFGGVAIGVLAKGPPGLLPLVFAPWCVPRSRAWLPAAVLMLPALAWWIGVERAVGTAFVEVGGDLAVGGGGGFAAWLASSFEHVVRRPIERAPHVVVLGGVAIVHALRHARGHRTWILLAWIALVVLATLAKPSQRLRYLLPALPPLAVLIGAWIATKRPRWQPAWIPSVLIVLALFTWAMPTAWWPANHRSGDARATMRATVAAQDSVLLIESDPRGHYGRQWAGRDWVYLHLEREVQVIAPDEAPGFAGRLAVVHASSDVDVAAEEIVRTPNARLVRLLSAPGNAAADR